MSSGKTPVIDSDEYYDLKILKDGTWIYAGTPITRHNLVKLFASVLKKDDQGDYWLETPYERGRIAVEDVPFIATSVKVQSSGKSQILVFETNLGDQVVLSPTHPLRIAFDQDNQTPRPYILVRGGLEARISRPVYYELTALAVADEKDEGTLGLWSSGKFFPLGKTA